MATLSFKDFAKGGAVSVVGNESNVQKQEAQSGNSFMKGLSRVADIYSKNVKEQFSAGLDRGAEALTTQPEAANNAIASGDKVAEGVAYARGGLRLSGGVAQSLFSPITAAIQTGIQGYAELDQATGGRVADQIKSVAQNNPDIVKGMSDFVAQNPEKVKDVEDLLNFLGAKAVTKSASMAEGGAKATVNGVADGVGAATNAIKDTTASVVGDVASKVMPTSEGIMQRVARIPKGEQVKFEKLTGKSVGQFLDETGNYGTPDKIVERLYTDFSKSKQTADDALATLQGTYRATPVRTALSELEGKVKRTSSPGAPDTDFSRVMELSAKEKAQGLSMTEINEVKRMYERRVRLDYLKGTVAEDVTRATNVDKAVHDWQMAEAEKAGLKNLQEINNFTQANKQLMDALGKELSGTAGNNALGLTDAILIAGGSPESIASLVTKKIFSDPGVRSYVAKKLSPNKVKVGVPEAQFKDKLQLPAPKEGAPSVSKEVPINLAPVTESKLDKMMVEKFGKTYEQVSNEVKSFWEKYGNETGNSGNVIKLDDKNKKTLFKFLNNTPDETAISLATKEKEIRDMYNAMYDSGIEKYNSIIKYVEGGKGNKTGVLPEAGVTSGKNSNGRAMNKNGAPLKFQKEGDLILEENGFKSKEDAQDFIDNFRNIIEQRKLLTAKKKDNIFVSEERYNKAKESLAKKGNRINSGIPVDQLPDMVTIASYHIGNGVKTAAELIEKLAKEGYDITVEQANKLISKVKEVSNQPYNATDLSSKLKNSLLSNPTGKYDKPDRFVGEQYSIKEASTGIAENGKNLKGRIVIGKDDKGNLIIKDGTHLLEAYRILKKDIPNEKIAFENGVTAKDLNYYKK